MPRAKREVSYYHPAIETLSREELKNLQWRRLKAMLEWVYYHNDFYRRKFDSVRMKPDDINTYDDFRKLPIITKEDLLKDQEDAPPYGARLGVDKKKLHRVYLTSGTSGKGQETWTVTREDREVGNLFIRMFYMGLDVRRGDLVADIFPISTGTLASPDLQVTALDLIGANLMWLGINYGTEEKVRMLARFNANVVMGTQSRRLMQAAQDIGIEPRKDMPGLKTIPGDFLNPASNLEMEEFFDAWAFDFYGTSATRGAVGVTCEYGTALGEKRFGMIHLFEDACFYEVLDRETKEPVNFGEEGELVETTLLFGSSPCIRFATNDKVVLMPPTYCRCGRPFAGMLVGATSRYDDMIKVKGFNVWPAAVDQIVLNRQGMAEYVATVFYDQSGREDILLQVQFDEEVPGDKRKEMLGILGLEIREKVGINVRLVEAQADLRSRVSDFKAKRWVDERKKGSLAVEDIIWRGAVS
ncbi:MAG: phenylacetate--CoA ligase family protein [Clostridia bacterium]|nr:MAG: phenylacetate--CoA ligase family protein [Clostridia bacterium]